MCATLFRSFATDYLSSPFVQALDPEQELWYVRLMLASVINNPPGYLSMDISNLWRLAKAPSCKYFRDNCHTILSKFEKDEAAGLYRLPMISEPLAKYAELSIKRAAAGKRGAASRWHAISK